MDVKLYVREGSRFVRATQPRRARPVPPIPPPVRVADEPDPRPNVTTVPVTRCEHGHFSRPGGPGRGCRPCGRSSR